MNFELISTELLDIINSNNINNVTHCATRLRVNVKNMDSIDTAKIEKVEGVLGIVKQGDTLQIIFGPNVQNVHDSFVKLYESNKPEVSDSHDDNNSKKKENFFSKALSFLAAAFLPTMPIVVATGLISAILNILVLTVGLATDSPT